MKRNELIGIIGAGKVGVVLAKLALRAGYAVAISGSGDPDKIRLSMSVLAPGAQVMTTEDVAQTADAIILALPLGNYGTLPVEALGGKLVLDATNYWWETDGIRHDLSQTTTASAELIQAHLKDSQVIKAFNHMGYHELHDWHRPEGAQDRKAIAVAGGQGSDDEGIIKVLEIVNNLGFDPVYAGTLHQSLAVQPHGSIFGKVLSKNELQDLLSQSS